VPSAMGTVGRASPGTTETGVASPFLIRPSATWDPLGGASPRPILRGRTHPSGSVRGAVLHVKTVSDENCFLGKGITNLEGPAAAFLMGIGLSRCFDLTLLK
jgi:hypothetical protein